MKRTIGIILRIVISAGLVIFLLWNMRGSFSCIARTLATVNLFLFALATFLFTVNITVLSFRLQLVFIGERLRISFGRVVQLSFIGYFFNNFMPSAVGGDIVKAYYAYHQTKEAEKSFVSVLMDRVIGLFSFMAIAILTLLVSWKNIDIMLKKIVLIFAFLGLIAAVVILNRTIAKFILKALSRLRLWNMGERLSKVYRAVHEYRNRSALLFMALGVSIVSQSIYFFTVYLLAKSLEAELLLSTVFLAMPIVSAVSMLPSLGGLGLRENAIVALFSSIIGSEKAFSLSILVLAKLLIISLVGAVIYVSASQFKIGQVNISRLNNYQV